MSGVFATEWVAPGGLESFLDIAERSLVDLGYTVEVFTYYYDSGKIRVFKRHGAKSTSSARLSVGRLATSLELVGYLEYVSLQCCTESESLPVC